MLHCTQLYSQTALQCICFLVCYMLMKSHAKTWQLNVHQRYIWGGWEGEEEVVESEGRESRGVGVGEGKRRCGGGKEDGFRS